MIVTYEMGECFNAERLRSDLVMESKKRAWANDCNSNARYPKGKRRKNDYSSEQRVTKSPAVLSSTTVTLINMTNMEMICERYSLMSAIKAVIRAAQLWQSA